jgi:hypothetical protein
MNNTFQDRLLPGERILWEGKPQTGLLFYARDGLLIPFSLTWGGFAIFWEWSVVSVGDSAKDASNVPDFFVLWGIPFVLIGLYMIFGRFFHDAWVRDRTRYAVTNQRVLILRLPPFSRFTALAIDRLPELSLDEKADGRGTIRFSAATSPWNGRGTGFESWIPALASTQFLMIPDARRVFDQIQKLGTKTA